MTFRWKRIRGLVRELLAETNVTNPPVPVDDIAKSRGLDLRISYNKDSGISGFLFSGGEKPIIGINTVHHENRQRFTIAHELGHYLLHHPNAEGIHVDHSFEIKLRSDRHVEGNYADEREANMFAAELLMPIDFIIRDLKDKNLVDMEDDGLLHEMANRYKVSQQAMAIRLSNLGYLTL